MGNEVVNKMVSSICSLLQPFVGQQSEFLSLMFLLALGVMVLLWFLNENKEGLIKWMIRIGLALGILINIFTIPALLGLPNICG